MRHLFRSKSLLTVLVMTAATLLAYGDALRLPFFFDDMTHYVWLRGQTLGSIFVSAAGRPYYRPMQFFLWKVYETLFRADSVVVYHALSLLVHVVDAALVVALVQRFSRDRERWWPAILAGLIFTWFPFSYQVVTLPASFTHPMVALFVLLGLLSYDVFRASQRRRWLVTAFIFGLLAFGSNEGSLLLAGLIALVEWLRPYPRKQWQWTAVFALLAGLFYVWYQTRPHDASGGLGVRSLETIIQNALYALQGLTFPWQPMGRVWMTQGLNDQIAVIVIALPTLAVIGSLCALARQFRRFIFGVGWFVICLTPPVLILSHDYFINAPRVLYLGSIGVAWLWASTIDAVADPVGRLRGQHGLALAMALIALAPSYIFIRQRMDLHNLNAAPLNAALDFARQAPPEEQLLFVNLPAWISTPQLWYPIGHEGALFMPSYSTMADFVSTNLNRPSRDAAVEFNSLSTPEPYYYGVYGPALGWEQLAPRVDNAARVYFTLYQPDKIELVEAGRVMKTHDPVQNPAALFGDAVVLEAADWAICANRLTARLDWQAASSGDWHVFVQVLNPDGTLAAQQDSPPLMGLRPFWQWSTGDRVEDVHSIDLAALLPDRSYLLVTGLYDPANGQRLTPTLANGEQPVDKAVRIGTLTIDTAQDCQ